MFSRDWSNERGILGDTDTSMRGYYTEAENAHSNLLIIFNHLNISACEIVHLGLAGSRTVGRRENELLLGAWIVLHAASTGATAQNGRHEREQRNQRGSVKPYFC
jgi:hypothetical protein